MSKLNELIKELCPNGVEYVSLGTVCSIDKGVQFNKADMNDEGTYPVINGGINPSGYIEQYNQDENTITISQGGASAGYVNWLETKFWAGAHCYVLKPKANVINRYAYHFVKSQEHKLQECQYGAGIPALAKGTIEFLPIPVPPIEVQREIVRILDNFTELTAELAAELTARKKQYEYYRNALLSFEKNSGGGVLRVKLGDVAKVLRGRRLTKNQLVIDGKYPVFHGGLEPLGYYNESNRRKNMTMVINVGASAGTVGYCDVDFWSSDGCFCIEPTKQLCDKYIYYALSTKENTIKSRVRKAGIPTLDAQEIEKIIIPVPSIEIQKRIVNVLDNFDAICSDLNIGLPAEIEARQKQYEFYRDNLLTFIDKGETILTNKQTNKQTNRT